MKARIHVALALAAVAYASPAATDFNWTAITPSHDLEYHACYESLRCARLLLPLDWLNASSPATIALAVIQSPAAVPVSDPTYGGPVISNPGGPGGSGVDHLRRAAAQHREMVDTPGRKHFEYVSFDPRGIGRTTPPINCYPADRLARAAASLQARGSGGLGGPAPAALTLNLGLLGMQADRCADANGDLLQYVGTTSVARDMLAVVDKIAAYNRKQTANKDADAHHNDAQFELRNADADADDLPRLQYIGFSYGTVLGNYFAAMFPGRVGRLLLDGVADTDDYATGDGWLANTVDTDEMVNRFFRGCYDAGADTCPLVRPGDKSGADISRRFWSWVAQLDESPTLVTQRDGGGGGGVSVLQSRDLRALLLSALYRPLTGFAEAAALADQAMRGNTSALYDLVTSTSGGPLADACPVGGGHRNDTAAVVGTPDAQIAILCGDGDSLLNRTGAFWQGYVARQRAQSSLAGALWSGIRLSCARWQAHAAWPFKGPFTTPAASQNASAPEPGRPAAPVFVLSNRFDPVTPLRAARKVAGRHPGAGVLVQEAMGHCVFGTHPATDCTRDLVRRYFDEGVVPARETTCEAACQPWSKCEEAGAASVEYGTPRYFQFPLHI
ncbi:Peptidase S33 tripeptidyl aminopeptidase-lik [Cordyceps militaris]|uniref:Peptidase S33 tripeptidyl aminopeptidase-lik n=1 Tax=Cordyceps militaris TaxID=73501 RepID=A0A2H4SHZ8_CORMI|nr:Peptidase S33 tripeptidyl aminopeptidase-lik [Cordyceps militaris]